MRTATVEGGTDVAEVEVPEEALPLDVVFDVLSNERRRRIIRYLLSVSTSTTLGELTEHVAGIENDKPPVELTSMERKRVYVCLYQHHLPKLDDVDAIDFDEHRKTVEASGNLPLFAEYLGLEGRRPPPGNGRRPARVVRSAWRRLRRWARAAVG